VVVLTGVLVGVLGVVAESLLSFAGVFGGGVGGCFSSTWGYVGLFLGFVAAVAFCVGDGIIGGSGCFVFDVPGLFDSSGGVDGPFFGRFIPFSGLLAGVLVTWEKKFKEVHLFCLTQRGIT
jgi:hypothetical protein